MFRPLSLWLMTPEQMVLPPLPPLLAMAYLSCCRVIMGDKGVLRFRDLPFAEGAPFGIETHANLEELFRIAVRIE